MLVGLGSSIETVEGGVPETTIPEDSCCEPSIPEDGSPRFWELPNFIIPIFDLRVWVVIGLFWATTGLFWAVAVTLAFGGPAG